MSVYENIFIAGGEKPSKLSRFLVSRFGLEYMPEQDQQDLGLRGQALTSDGFVGLRVYSNNFVEPDAAPDDVQAFDAYPVQIDLWLPRPDVDAQEAEGRAWFDRLVDARPDLPVLLVHDVVLLYAAHLPGRSVHDFPKGTSVDFPDIAVWLPWVAKTDTDDL